MAHDIYPITIIADRYNGVYSQGKFIAWNCFEDKIPRETGLGDPECMDFWHNFKQGHIKIDNIFTKHLYVGKGNTPNDALENLKKQMKNAI